MVAPVQNQPKDIDALLDSALSKIQNPAEDCKEEINVEIESTDNNDLPSGNIEAEVDKMLREFARMMPGSTGEELKGKTSAEQIEETFKQLMQEPVGGDVGDEIGELGDMNAIIEQMMSELTSKEVLYEPFAEMIEKYPGWLEENGKNLDSPLLTNYQGQLRIARQVVALFDQPDYAQRKGQYQSQIFTLMQSMQEYGAPPEGLLTEAPPTEAQEQEPSPEMIPPGCNQM